MKHICILVLQLCLCCFVSAQQTYLDSLHNQFAKASTDSGRYGSALKLYVYYEEANRDSALYYADRCLLMARINGRKLNMVVPLCNKAYQQLNLGKFAESLQNLLDAYAIAEDSKNEKYFWVFDKKNPHEGRLYGLAYAHHINGVLMWRIQNSEQEIFHFKMAKKIATEINNYLRLTLANMNLGRAYAYLHQYDTALVYEKEAERIGLQYGTTKYLAYIYHQQGIIYLNKGDTVLAKKIFYQSVSWGVKENYLSALGRTYNEFAKLYIRDQNKDSALYYANKSISILLALGSLSGTEYNLATAYEVLIKAFQLRNQSDSAYKYQQLALRVKDSIYVNRINNLTSFYNLTLKETLRLQNIEKEKKIYQEKVRVYALLLGLGIVFLIAIALFRINHQRKLVNKNLEQTLVNLKATQSQLIQSEKMASLGELTAGIAHEIQNPLNFVNNFSEVNKELLAEMNEEIDKGNFSEVKAIAKDITENEVKINHHGKRADAIVKGMLQHSRSSNGVKEPTDINNLADEYFRLAYHGLRAKDKSFNATMKTEFDGSVGNVNIISQDIGRVILNLITNAFYAVTDRKKKNEEGYEPTVSLSTQKTADKVIIKVRDNGNGIPEKVKEKIFLPFFTTKPTGEGTGLGLSMSYDIVTKGHGGELSVTTEDGKYTEFSIVLPIQQT